MGKKGKKRGNGNKKTSSPTSSNEVSSFSNIDIGASPVASSPLWSLQGIPAMPAPPTTTPQTQLSSPRSPLTQAAEEEAGQYRSPITLNQYPSKFNFPETENNGKKKKKKITVDVERKPDGTGLMFSPPVTDDEEFNFDKELVERPPLPRGKIEKEKPITPLEALKKPEFITSRETAEKIKIIQERTAESMEVLDRHGFTDRTRTTSEVNLHDRRAFGSYESGSPFALDEASGGPARPGTAHPTRGLNLKHVRRNSAGLATGIGAKEAPQPRANLSSRTSSPFGNQSSYSYSSSNVVGAPTLTQKLRSGVQPVLVDGISLADLSRSASARSNDYASLRSFPFEKYASSRSKTPNDSSKSSIGVSNITFSTKTDFDFDSVERFAEVESKHELPASIPTSFHDFVVDGIDQSFSYDDERDRIQKKTFTKWCNQHLKKSGSTIDDLYEDLRDGFKLLSLLQNLSGQSLNRASATQGPRMFMAREKGRNRIHRVQNVQFALDFLKKRKVRLVNIRAEDIVDGNPKLILGLVWSIILHFQVEEIVIEGDDSQQRLTAKKALLQWARQNMEGYDTNVNNFTTDWSDGMAFNVIMHRNKPEIIDLTKVSQMSNRERLANAFDTAEKKFGITPLLDPEDVDVAKPDEKSIITYVSSLYDVFPKVPPKPAMVTSEEWEYVLTEYRRVYTKIIEWCSTQITIIRRKKAPKSSEEAEEMLREFTVFQSEREQTAALRDECRSLWNQLNSLAAQSRGEFTIGPELDINPMEVRWDELNAEADRHGNFLQSELERLKRLEEICKKMDSEIDETNETLNTAGEWLKKLASDDLSDLPLDLDPVAEVTNCLNRAEGQIRSLSAKVEELRSARYHRSEEYYEIVAQLNSRLVDMNCEYDRLKRLGLLDPISIKERRKLRPPLEESIEWKDLLDAENVLQRSVEELEQVTAGVDGASAEENLNKINDLLKSFANFLDPTVDKLENYYSNFDQGTKDYKAYDERYRKWKSSAQDHLASLKRRVQDQQKCTEFLQSCEECSSELMAIIDELQSDDWSDENKDVAEATAAFEDYSKRVQIICRNIDSVLGHGPLTASQISRGKDLIENYIFKLQHEKQMAAAILEAYEVQVRLLSQYKEFFVEIGDLKKQIHDRKITVQSICTNLDESSAAERAEKLEEIKFTFSSLSVKMMELETQSKSITNIKARRYRTEKHFAARTVTRVKNVDLNIARNEPLTLVDSSKPEAWQLFTETGQNVTLPAITITLPPPNKLAEEAVQELKSEMTQLKGNWEQSKANCAYYQASGKFHENAGKILQWDSLPPINTRSSAMSSLENAFKEAGRHVEDSRNDSVQRDYDEMPNIINNCQRHIDDLEAKEHAANEAEKERLRREQLREELARKAQSLKDYLAGLQQKLDNAKKDILHRVSIAIAFENPHEAAQDAQRSINDLEAIRAGSNRVHGELSELEASEEAPEGIELAKADLEQIRADVNQFQALSQVYIRKVQKVQVVIGQVQATENIIARLEEKVNSQLNQATSNSEAMELKLRLLKNSTFELGAQDALLQTLSEAAGEAKALGQQVEQESNIPDPDEYIYGFTVQKLQDRLQSLKDKLKSEIDQLESEIPILKSQENAAEASQRGIHDASRLLNELEHIANAADKELRREHAESFDVRASLSRCDDFSKRLNNVRSPVRELVNEINAMINDPNLTDGVLKGRLEEAAQSLQSAQQKADDNVAGIQHKMNELQSAMDALAVTRAILEKYQMTLSADSVCSTIDDYEHKMALLQELQKEIPENDPKFAGLKSHLTELPDNDLDRNRLNVEMNDHMNEWNQLKWQLNMALESNKKELDKKIREREHENSVGSLRSKIAEFIAKIEKMSAQQIDVLSAEHEMTVATFYNELQAQQEVLDVFNNRIEGEYKALRNECDQLQLPNEECQELQSAWERVWKLTKHTIDKLKALRAYTEQVEKAQAVLAKWTLEAERFERESENTDPDFLTKLSKDAQRAYAATKEDDETFVLSIFAANISSAHAPVAHEAQDRDMAQAQSISEDLSAQWNAVKQRLQVASKTALNNSKLRQSENQTREAGKQLEFVSNLKDRLTRLSEKITKKLNTPTPLELSDLEVVLTENTALSTEVKEIGREVDMTSKSTMEMLRKSRDVDTEIATQLRSMLESITGLWGPIDSVWNVYEDKCRRFRNCVEKYGGARIQLENTEDELTRIEIVSQTVEERDEKLKRLKELQASFSQIEPLFFSLESSHSEVKSVETRMQTKGYSDESFETLTVLVQSLIARWRNAKTEIIRRQTDVKDAFDKLGKFKQSIKKHVTFVENKEKELDSILATQAETSEAIQRKLSKVEGLQKEINSLQDEFVQVEEQGEQLNETIRDANANCEKWAESCEKTLSLPTLERYVEIEIETVTRKYDKLGRMVAEQIERLKIKVRETKAQEDEIGMAERKVAEIARWIDETKEKKNDLVLPDTLKATGDVIIEIEEIIETVVSRRPVVNAAAGFAVEVIEKYERSAKMTLDDESENRKQTSSRLSKLESNTEEMKRNFEKLLASFLSMQEQLKSHLSKLQSERDLSGLQSEMESMRLSLLALSDGLKVTPPDDLLEAQTNFTKLQQLATELKEKKPKVLEIAATSRSTSRNQDLSTAETQQLHLDASTLEDLLHETSTTASEASRSYSHLMGILSDFEQRHELLQSYLEEVEKELENVSAVNDVLSDETDSSNVSRVEKLSRLKDLVRELEGEKKADLKLLEMSKEKYQLASKEFRRALQLDDAGQLFGEDGQRHRLVDSKYERVQQNFGLLSNKAAEKFQAYGNVLEVWKEYEGVELNCKSWLQEAEIRLSVMGAPSTDLATLNEQIIDAKTARHDADGHKNSFKRLDQTARAIGRLGDELVSHRDQQRVSRQTQKLRQGFQALSDKIDMKVKELMEMGNELQQLQEKITNANNEAEVAARVLKEVSRAARADKNLLEERRDRLKLSQTEIKRAEREIKESGEKAALKVLSKCGEENARAVREKLASAQRRTEGVVEDIEKEERKLSRMIELLSDFENHADHLENEIQTLQNPKACEVKLGNLRESASYLLDSGNFSDHSPVTLRLDRLNRMLANASEQSRERRNALENEKRRETEREREFENVKIELGQFDVVSIQSLANLPADLNKLDNLITKWENLEPKLEYLESTSESPIMQPGSTASLRRRSRTRRQGGTLPRNSGRLSGASASGVEGLRLKYESIGDRLINTRNVGQILLEQLEVWHSNQVKAEHIMKNLADSSSLISAMGDVAEAVRSGKAVITTCRTKLDNEPKDLPKLESEVDQLQKQFNDVQQEIMDARLSKDQKSKDIDHWQQRFLNLSDWTSDQWSLMSVLGKISADPAILEPQRQQVDALLSEFNSRKERYNQLQADCLSLNDSSKSQDMKQLSSRWNELEQKLEERKIAIDEALKCTREIEQETAKLQDFLTTVTADLAISSRLPPVPDSVEDCLKKLKQHQTQVPEMEKSAKLAQQAAEFLAQVASGAENHGNKSHSVGQALFISTKKLDEKIGTLTELLANIDEAYKLRSELFNSINAIEKGPTYGREEINALRSKYDELVSLVEDISENTSPIRNNSLREDKRSIQRKIKALETGLDQRERDESRRARKQAQLLSFINEREQQIASTHEGEAQPDAIHQKITLVQTLKDELTARMGELKAQFGGPTDSQVQQSFNNLLEKSTDRAKELQDAKLQAEELDGLLHDFNEWAEDSLEKILAATNLKSPETLYEMQTMMEECKDQRGEIELICSLLKGVEPAGKRWGGRPLEQVHSDALHTLDRIKSLLSERTEAADDALNRVKRFEESIEKLTAWYREIGDDLDKIKAALDLTEPEVIDKMVDDVGRISTILQSKMATREIMSRECQMMNFDLAEGMKDSVEEKLSKLESTASETELKCRELQNLLEKVQRASMKYAEVRDELLPWVEDMEVRLDQFDDVSLPDESLIEDLSQMSEEIAERRLLADRLVLTADKLAPLGAIQVKNEAAQISSRYSDIRERCRQRKRETQQLAIEHQQYSERLNNLNNALQRIDERLSNSDRPECNVEKCRAAMADLNQLSKELDKLEAAKTTLQKTGQSQLSDPKINSELAKIDSTWDHLQNTLKNKRDRLRQTEAASERFWAKNSQFQNQLDQLEGELREIKPTHDGKRDMDQFEKKITAMAGLNKKVSDTARDLGSLGENSEALRMAREGQSQLDRIARNMQQKQNEIEAAAKEHENMQRKAREALSWMQSADVRLKAQGEPNSPDDCREKLRVISDIKNQAPKFAAALPAASWRQFENRLAEEVRDTENKLISMGHFDQALDEISDWTSRCSTTLSSIGQDASALQTDFARAELIMSELESRQRALEKLRETAVERFPLKQKRLIAISDNLSKIGSIASTKHDVIRSRIEAAESTELKKKKVQRWAADIREYLINDGPYSGSSEGAKAQSDECRNKISEMVKQRGECPAALPDVRWQQMETALSERKNKLGNLQLEVDTFWDAAKKMDKSLGQFESQIQKMQPPSVVEDSTNLQIEQNRKLEDDIRLKTNQVKTIEDLSGSLRANINREDAIQVKNAALSIHSRWEKCLQATNRRNLALEENRKRATKYSEMVIELVDFIDLSRSKLEEAKSSCDPRNGKRLLTKHSEIEREIARNEKGYDNVKKEAAHLLKIAKLPSDVTAIEVELKDIQNKWGNLQNLSWNFVKDLQDSMVSSGRLIDALESLEEWLIKVEPELSERRPLEGDLDTVERLLENHRDFKRELEERERSFSDIRRLVVDLSEQDAAWMRPQISGLGSRWENLRTLSRRRDDKLARAKVRAQEFQDEVNNTLNWLAIAEERLDNIAMLLDGDTSGSLLDKAKRNQSDLVADMDKNKAQLDRAVQLGNGILTNADPDAVGTLKHWLGALTAGWQEVQAWIEQLGERIKRIENDDADAQQRLDALLNWLTGAQDQLSIRNRSPLPADITRLKQLAAEHQQFQEEILARQTEFDELIRIYKKNSSSNVMRESYGSLKRNTKITNQGLVEFKNSKAALLSGTWQSVWLAALERQRAIANALDGAEESQFDFDTWRKRYMAWMNHKKSRVMETMRSFDKNNTGFIENKRFINGVIDSGFDTNEREMRKVVKMFDRDGNGQIDYYEFISALHPRDQYKPETDAAKIEDEVIREVSRCRCCERFAIHQISDNKYRFGDSQQLRLVRILKSTVMVRVGGGWMALEEFLSKNDPCRARGKVAPRSDGFPTDPLADGVSQTMSAFTRKSRRDRHNSTSSQQPIRTTPTDRPNTRPGSRIPSRNPSRSNSRAGSRAGSRDPSPHNRIPNLSVLSPKSLTPQGLISPMSHRSSGRKTPSGYKTPSGRKTPSSNSKTGDSDIAEAARRLYTLQTERNSKL